MKIVTYLNNLMKDTLLFNWQSTRFHNTESEVLGLKNKKLVNIRDCSLFCNQRPVFIPKDLTTQKER